MIYTRYITRYIIRKTKNKKQQNTIRLVANKKHKGLPWLPWLLLVTFLGIESTER